MAWSTCPHCPTRLNGWDNMDRHQRKEHLAEYRIAYAQNTVRWAEEQLAGHVKDKAEYEVLDSFLSRTGLPALVLNILNKEREQRQVTFYLKGNYIVRPFDEQLTADANWLAQKQAELAALQQEVTA